MNKLHEVETITVDGEQHVYISQFEENSLENDSLERMCEEFESNSRTRQDRQRKRNAISKNNKRMMRQNK